MLIPVPGWSVQMADMVIRRGVPLRWRYQDGLILKAIEQVWLQTRHPEYFDYIKEQVDALVTPAGEIKTYTIEEYNLDQVNMGKILFPLYRATGDERYHKAASLLMEQLKGHPRTRSGGFWHKKIYPYQMWLDGIYMASPFYAEYAGTFDAPGGFDDVVFQILHLAEHTRDPQSGLLYHAWDESKSQGWANPVTGCSPHFWGRAMGWYAMAIMDVLDYLPAGHVRRPDLAALFQQMIASLLKVQDPETGLWYQVLDQGTRAGNYLEASCSSMFIYAIAKAVRNGYLDRSYLKPAHRAYQGLIQGLLRVDEQGALKLDHICASAGLGGNPYRDGSYDYYVNERIETNNPHGVGAFILASVEIERITPL